MPLDKRARHSGGMHAVVSYQLEDAWFFFEHVCIATAPLNAAGLRKPIEDLRLSVATEVPKQLWCIVGYFDKVDSERILKHARTACLGIARREKQKSESLEKKIKNPNEITKERHRSWAKWMLIQHWKTHQIDECPNKAETDVQNAPLTWKRNDKTLLPEAYHELLYCVRHDLITRIHLRCCSGSIQRLLTENFDAG